MRIHQPPFGSPPAAPFPNRGQFRQTDIFELFCLASVAALGAWCNVNLERGITALLPNRGQFRQTDIFELFCSASVATLGALCNLNMERGVNMDALFASFLISKRRPQPAEKFKNVRLPELTPV
jgi:hypothetical protein